MTTQSIDLYGQITQQYHSLLLLSFSFPSRVKSTLHTFQLSHNGKKFHSPEVKKTRRVYMGLQVQQLLQQQCTLTLHVETSKAPAMENKMF